MREEANEGRGNERNSVGGNERNFTELTSGGTKKKKTNLNMPYGSKTRL